MSRRVHPSLARCWVRTALEADDLDLQVSQWVNARYWDRFEPTLIASRKRSVSHWLGVGLSARERKDWSTAYNAFSNAVAIDPSQSRARRYAEEARDQRLKLNAAKPAPKAKRSSPPSTTPFANPFTKPGPLNKRIGNPQPAREEAEDDAPDGAEGDGE